MYTTQQKTMSSPLAKPFTAQPAPTYIILPAADHGRATANDRRAAANDSGVARKHCGAAAIVIMAAVEDSGAGNDRGAGNDSGARIVTGAARLRSGRGLVAFARLAIAVRLCPCRRETIQCRER